MSGRNPTAAGVSAPDALKGLRTAEEQLEIDIEAAKQRMCAAPDYDEKLRHWREMVRLIDQRTPSRRRFMERMAGLR